MRSMFVSHTISSPGVHQLTLLSSQSQPQPPPSGQPSSNQQPSTTTPSQPSPPALSSASASSEPIKPVESVTRLDRPKSTSTTNRAGSNSTADSTDWIASSLTRRFGIGAGLAWVGFLAVGVVSEQIKTRLEVSQQEGNIRDVTEEKEVQLPNGIRYYDMRVGGGATPMQGDLVVIGLKGTVVGSGQVFVNTFGSGKKAPLVLVMGSRPYTRGMCEGVEYVLQSMKAGGKRRAIIPPNLGFKEEGADFGEGQVPPDATLEYVVEVERVSIAPA